MAHAIDPTSSDWTAADLVTRFGAIPLARIRQDPVPGCATEQDVVALHEGEGRLYELADGVLMEKTVGTYESYLAALIGRLLGNFVSSENLGIVLGADGIMHLAPGLIRIPDVSFISWSRLPNGEVPRTPIAELAPDLAVEVISKYNTREEMQRKLHDYFSASVRAVWYVYPDSQEVKVYHSPDQVETLGVEQTLDGGDVLPGFSLALRTLFASPSQGGLG